MTTESFEKVAALPIRTASGKWKQVIKKRKIEFPTATGTIQGKSAKQKKIDANTLEAAKRQGEVQQMDALKNMSVEAAKSEIGILAVDVTENPEENLRNIKMIMKFASAELFDVEKREGCTEVQSTALITVLAILKDIIPGYYIRPLTEAEKTSRISNVVKSQRDYDESLLFNYRAFITRLEEIMKTTRRGDTSLVPVAIACFGELSVCAGHFNFSERVFTALISQIHSSEPMLHELTAKAIERTFGEDQNGKATSLLTRMISDTLFARNYQNIQNGRIIEAFLSIRSRNLYASKNHGPTITTTFDATKLEAYTSRKRHMSKSDKKDLKARLEESSKTAAAEAEYTMQERQKWSTDTLKFVFRVLFGILKAVENVDIKSDNKNMIQLLPSVLKCLARFSSYLSVEFYADLLVTLRRVITNNSVMVKDLSTVMGLSFESIVHLIQTVLQISALQESNPNVKGMPAVDLKFYYDLLYREMLRIAKDKPCLDQWRTLEPAFEMAMAQFFLSKRNVPAERIAAFCHRILLLVDLIAAKHEEASKYLARLLYRLLERHERARAVLDADGGIGIGGAYRPACPDPDYCNPFSKQLEYQKVINSNKSLCNECRQTLKNLSRLAAL